MALDKRSQVSLTFGTNINHCLIRLNISRKYYDFGLNSYMYRNINALGIKFVLAINYKVGQGQPRFIICANLVGPTSPMLQTKSQGHWPFGSREEDI